MRQAFNSHKEFADGKGRILKASGVPGVADKVQWFQRDAVIADLKKQFHDFLGNHEAETVDVDDVSIDELLADYFGKNPPFVGDLPKPEFPDAINAKALCEWAEFNEVDLFVVSGDEGFREAFAACKQIHVFDQLEKLLDRVADDDKKLADFIRAQAIAHIDDIKAEAVKEYEGLWFYLKDEDGEAEVTVEDAKFDGDVEVLELGDGEATVVVSFSLEYTAEASCADPHMSRTIAKQVRPSRGAPKKQRFTIAGERGPSCRWFEGLDPSSVQIENVRLVSQNWRRHTASSPRICRGTVPRSPVGGWTQTHPGVAQWTHRADLLGAAGPRRPCAWRGDCGALRRESQPTTQSIGARRLARAGPLPPGADIRPLDDCVLDAAD